MTTCPVLSSAPAPYVSLLGRRLDRSYARGLLHVIQRVQVARTVQGDRLRATARDGRQAACNVALVATGTNVMLVNLEDPLIHSRWPN